MKYSIANIGPMLTNSEDNLQVEKDVNYMTQKQPELLRTRKRL
jgi:hypothetical protein